MNDSANRLRRFLHLTWHQTRRVVIGIVGASVVFVGVVMIVAPGPAFIVIPAGLAILAIEFVWARRLLRRIKLHTRRLARRKLRSRDQRSEPCPPDSEEGRSSWFRRPLFVFGFGTGQKHQSPG